MSSGRPVSLLSLDGGGVRGISTIVILKEIMRQVNEGRPRGQHVQPWQVFDLIGGTSTGGIIAIMVGSLKMTLDECERAYMDMAEEIFQPKRRRMNPTRGVNTIRAGERYDSRSMETVAQKIIAQKTKNPHIKLKKQNPDAEACKVFVTTVLAEHAETCLLRNYDNAYQSDGISDRFELWEALRATSAANTHFQELVKNGICYLDGAVKGNNPVYEVMMEADEVWDDPTAVMLSIGTGEKEPTPLQGDYAQHLKTYSRITVNAADTDRNFRRDYRRMADGGRMFRFDVPDGGRVKLGDYEAMLLVKQDTERFLRGIRTREEVWRCAEQIKRVFARRASLVR